MKVSLRVEKYVVLSLILFFEKDTQAGNCMDLFFS